MVVLKSQAMYPSRTMEPLKQAHVSTVRVVTDSLADIPPEVLRELNITTVPCIVRFGDTEYRDRVDLPTCEFYQKLAVSPILPTTAVPSYSVFEEIYLRLAEETDQILAIHTIASLTGIFNASRLAASEISNAQIELVDSQQVSMSLGWLAIIAARAARAGTCLAEIKSMVEDAIHRVHIVAMLDTLEYAQRGGRLGKGAALIGSLLNVKPLLSAAHGEIVPVGSARTQKRALERLVEIVGDSGPVQEIAVVHAHAIVLAEQLQRMLAQIYPDKHILLSETGPVLGTHAGPGAVGIAWLSA